MRISAKWVREYVDTALSPDDLAQRLTMLGLEAEEVMPLDPGIDRVIVARVSSVSPHPNADKLSVCVVETGSGAVRVVCGAPNVRPGMVAPLALDGARLPSGMTIRVTSVRGVESHGMLCSARELQLSDDASGLMELPAEVAVGTPLREALGLDDTAIELGVAANRPDCLSIVGVAREIATSQGLSLRVPKPIVAEGEEPTSQATTVEVRDPELCPRYAARVIRGVRIAPSPAWLVRRLHAVGLRSINNVVDVTNYVLMELGHPLHAFDDDRLAENRIVVRRAMADESIQTLDGEERNLTSETLVIADAEKPVALAGIMGGRHSEVTSETRNVLLESAYFNPISIRRTAKVLGLKTEASFRFERGADPEGVLRALDRAAELILQVAGGEACRGVVDVYPARHEAKRIELKPERVNALLGTDIAGSEMVRILRGLGCGVEEGDPLVVVAPTFRPDLTRDIDLVEEIVRVSGFASVPTTLPVGESPGCVPDPYMQLRRRIASVMVASGFREVCNYGFYGPASLDRIRIGGEDPLRDELRIANPLSAEISVMRTSLLPSLMENVRHNRRRQVEHIALFEVSRVFHDGSRSELPRERWMLGAALCGARRKHWSSDVREPDYYDAKGVVEAILESIGVQSWNLERSVHPTFHPGRTAEIRIGDQILARFGEVHPDVLSNYELIRRTLLIEMDVDLLAANARTERWMEPLPLFPSSNRDLAVVVDASVPAEAVMRTIRDTVSPSVLASVSLFDVYSGDQIAEEEKSLAFSLEYRSSDRTLTDAEVDRFQSQITHVLEEQLGARLRS